ncbi:MAG: aminopeptidase [Bacteroidia bacterium]|nr:aminopeptidase [Bacteroidia bacterium]MDW8348207.1 C1 family peptidase [Bacteroidia bacterium]
MKSIKQGLFVVLLVVAHVLSLAQQSVVRNKKMGGYEFTVIKDLEATEVKDQMHTGTCWSFSGMSFFESEILRVSKKKVDLSEMFIVRNAYLDKAEQYVRMHGLINFGQGGSFHDDFNMIKKYGIVPQSAYSGLKPGETKYNHDEMEAVLKAMLKAVVDRKTLTPHWKEAIKNTVDAYMGTPPAEFEYEGKKYTPHTFAQSLGLDMNDYIVITSFTHHPFYSKFVLEVQDNWAMQEVYNLPLEDMMKVLENSIMNGYTVAWASDVSEKGFSFRNGLAIVPSDENQIEKRGEDNQYFSDAGATRTGSPFDAPCHEKQITQEMRQQAFDNYETTDDHGMHITGLFKDQTGKKFYKVKNSWGNANDNQGYFFASEAFIKYKTTNFMVHKDAIPKEIAKKMGLR